jgi:cell division protein FtsI/penicillin-binding protein 2
VGRRIRWLGVIMVVCLGLVVAQLVNIQLIKAKQLQTSPNNPGVAALRDVNPRGEILAADGTVLADTSVTTPKDRCTRASRDTIQSSTTASPGSKMNTIRSWDRISRLPRH